MPKSMEAKPAIQRENPTTAQCEDLRRARSSALGLLRRERVREGGSEILRSCTHMYVLKMSYEMTVETPTSCAEIAEVQDMNMRRSTAPAPPFPRMVWAAKGRTSPAPTSDELMRRGKVGKLGEFSRATATSPAVVARVNGLGIGVGSGNKVKRGFYTLAHHRKPGEPAEDVAWNSASRVTRNSLLME